jgi:hypothetical protein
LRATTCILRSFETDTHLGTKMKFVTFGTFALSHSWYPLLLRNGAFPHAFEHEDTRFLRKRRTSYWYS